MCIRDRFNNVKNFSTKRNLDFGPWQLEIYINNFVSSLLGSEEERLNLHTTRENKIYHKEDNIELNKIMMLCKIIKY